MTHRDRFPGNASSTLKSRAISMLRSKAALESKCTASSYNPVRNVSLFVWRTSRATASLESIVPPDFKGIIQCDGYQAYETFASSPARAGRIELAGCLAHMRRKFLRLRRKAQTSNGCSHKCRRSMSPLQTLPMLRVPLPSPTPMASGQSPWRLARIHQLRPYSGACHHLRQRG